MSSDEPNMGGGVHSSVPRCTYRLQFSRDFTFRDAAAIVPYLGRLGVSHVYASPCLKARPESLHGYDIVDHASLNPELGDEAAFDALVEALRREGMGLILDIVPNHMGVGGSDNRWWLDVLENGQASGYAEFFDIDWDPVSPHLKGKLLIPILGGPYGSALQSGELTPAFDEASGELSLWYYQHRLPLDPATYPAVLEDSMEELRTALGDGDRDRLEYESLMSSFRRLPPALTADSTGRAERDRDKEIFKQRLASLSSRSGGLRDHIDRCLARFTRDGNPEGFADGLHDLLELQPYRLTHWKVAADEVNYRRFFDINDLAGLCVEQEEVFRRTHELIVRLVGENKVQGLRVDHPDGLHDPETYLRQLRSALAGSASSDAPGKGEGEMPLLHYVVVEKILAPYEELPSGWPVQGTTGYDVLNILGGVFVYGEGERRLTSIYQRFTGERRSFEEILYACKKQVIRDQLSSELTVLSNMASAIAESDRRTRDFTLNGLRSAIEEIVACFPVYRTYVSERGVGETDRRFIDWAIARARKNRRGTDATIFDFLRGLLLLEPIDHVDESLRLRILRFSMKVQQYTAPVMAKGLEDTSFYRFNRLVSLNDVGGEPTRFGVSLGAFHHLNQRRAQQWPHAMLTTSTHDAKRSEDVRARIAVLSECGDQWNLHVGRWGRVNRRKKSLVDKVAAPCRNDEYLLYQTLLGAWPLGDVTGAALEQFRQRMEAHFIKALREAKGNTSWANPQEDYEEAALRFLRELLDESPTNPFLKDFLPFQRQIAFWGLLNSLSQTLLKLTLPGVPDIYQGTEFWDFSLVDPDNRRPVDFAARSAALDDSVREFSSPQPGEVLRLAEDLSSDRVKMFLLWKVLELRSRCIPLFREGTYVPLSSFGVRSEHVCAFARTHGDHAAVIVAPRFFARLTGFEVRVPLREAWGDTYVELPEDTGGGRWLNVFTGLDAPFLVKDNRVRFRLAELMTHFPAALLVPREPFRFGPAGAKEGAGLA